MTERSKIAIRQQNAAKCRRLKENAVLVSLSRLLPVPYSVATREDKASIVRLSSAYLKLRELFPNGLGREWGEGSQPDGILQELGTFLNSAFDGFVFVLGDDAKILYVSEAASTHLGLPQLELIGNSFYSFIHEYDIAEVKKLMCHEQPIPALNAGNAPKEDIEVPRNFEIRMKCTLPKRQAELAVEGYKVIHCRGYLKLRQKTRDLDYFDPSVQWYRVVGVVASGHSLTSAPIAEIKMHGKDFMFRTGLDFKFIYLEPRVEEIIGYELSYFMDKSLYQFIHPEDCQKLREAHLSVLTKSQAITAYYRFLTRGGGWIWIQSSCVIPSSYKANSQHYILVFNNVLSGREYEELSLDIQQLHKPRTKRSKSYNISSQKSNRTRKKSASSNLSNYLHQNKPSVPSLEMQVSRLDHLQEKLFSQAPELAKSNLETDLLEFDKIMRYSGVAFNSLAYCNPSTLLSPNNNLPCLDFINSNDSYGSAYASLINNSLPNVKFNISGAETNVPGSTVYSNTYSDGQETIYSLLPPIHNSCYEPASYQKNYLNDSITGENFASSGFTASVKKVEANELPADHFSVIPTTTNHPNDFNVAELREFTNSSTSSPAEVGIGKAFASDFPTDYVRTEHGKFTVSNRIHEPGIGEMIANSSTMHLSEVNYDMLNYAANESLEFDTSVKQMFDVISADQKQANGFCLSTSFEGTLAEQQASTKTTVEAIYFNDKSQNSFQDIPDGQSFSVNAADENRTNYEVPRDFKNGDFTDAKERPINSGRDISPGRLDVQPSNSLSSCNELTVSSTDNFQNSDNLPIFSDIANLITNAIIFPKLNDHEVCSDLAFKNEGENNPLQLCQNQIKRFI